MAFDLVTSSYKERGKQHSPLQQALRAGLSMGSVTVFLSAVGIVRTFNERWTIDDVLTLSHALLGFFALMAGVLAARGIKAMLARA